LQLRLRLRLQRLLLTEGVTHQGFNTTKGMLLEIQGSGSVLHPLSPRNHHHLHPPPSQRVEQN
jgi:hypothetical protein